MNKKATLIVAGPGAGKTHNMVNSILEKLPSLSQCRYLAVITYTNPATHNIRKRLEEKILIPENLFVGTIHSFLNRFIVVPFSSISNNRISSQKLFLQCGLDDVFAKVEKGKDKSKRAKTKQEAALIKSRIRERLNTLGYITFDQTLSIAKDCIADPSVARLLSNRLQYLFVDEFQDTGNIVFDVIERIRKQNKTAIYCVGDPEQYIQSFDSSIKEFKNIPILKASIDKSYECRLNSNNYRSTLNIVKFLNNFNGRYFNQIKFQQEARSKSIDTSVEIGPEVMYIQQFGNVLPMLSEFEKICNSFEMNIAQRCILAKRNDVIKRIISASNNRYMNPKKSSGVLPVAAIQDALLATLQLNQAQFFEKYRTDILSLRKFSVAIFKAIQSGQIKDENTYGNFVSEVLKLDIKEGLPVKIENLKFDNSASPVGNVVTIANIHTIKGLQSDAVLAIAKSEAELLLWLETDTKIRDSKRDTETTDYPRLGYVAFSRAERLLCIACLEKISDETKKKLAQLAIKFV